ncbi:MAG: Panacea domain-containing protein [Candidatus Methanofastidiosia archaeon]|jgi:hypothetical protein
MSETTISSENYRKKVDLKKLEQVLHYIIQKVGILPNVGKTVLMKYLYFCDFDYYELYERYLTGEQYYRLEKGPAPANFDRIIEELERKKKIKKTKVNYHGYKQEKFISLENPDISLLSATELSLIDETLQRFSAFNATQISAYSHLDTPWRVTDEKDVIDYDLVFYRDPITSVREYE